MLIGIYNEPFAGAGGLGGSEYLLLCLAGALSHRHDVEFVHHHRDLTIQQLSDFSGLDLRRVRLRYVAKVEFQSPASASPWRLWQHARNWQADLSRPYDFFVIAAHSLPPFCHAKRGMLIVLFPMCSRERSWPFSEQTDGRWNLKRTVRNSYYDLEWKRRFRTYDYVVSISEFTRNWTARYWQVDSTVVYPPVAIEDIAGVKRNEILSVGRFTPHGHTKKYPEMIRAIGELDVIQQRAWSYHCVGSLNRTPDDGAYFDQISSLIKGAIFLHPNISRDELRDRYRGAKLFVHAAGYNEPDSRPHLAEHFGIATVEAMAAGCVPLVVNKGAQPEIVTHGVNGFVWNDVAELQRYVRLLVTDDVLRQKLATAARERSRRFNQDMFISQVAAMTKLEVAPRSVA